MEPATLAVAVATLLFSEALKEGGKALGKSASEVAAKLIATVHGKFKASGTEGVLTRAENDPTQQHIDAVQDELSTQMEDDEGYAAQLQDLVHGVVRQEMAIDLEEVETLEAQSLSQTAAGRVDVVQRMLKGVKKVKNIKIGEMKQEA
jgi:hypothetical protein